MFRIAPWIPILILTAAVFPAGCGADKPDLPSPTAGTPAPAEYAKGEAAYNRYCVACHGQAGSGTERGPTFIHRIYEPNHHGDPAFLLAPRNGVRAHHWNFGDMPKVEGVTDDDLKEIVSYIRWLQRQAGIR